MKKFLLIILLCAGIVACDKDRPEWIDSGEIDSPTQISAVGFGDSKLDAVAHALGELSRKIDAKVESLDKFIKDETSDTTYAENVTRGMSSIWFGEVKVESLLKNYTRVSGEEMEDFYQETVKISLGDSLNSYKIKSFRKETSHDNKSELYTYIDASGNNLNFASLLNELKEAGLKMKTYETEKEYYVLLVYDKENLKK